jgi:hypothetical protein
MKKFERFIIYPMLFIAIFFSFADDGVQQTTAQQVYDELIAKSLTIVNDSGEKVIKLKSNQFGGKISLEEPNSYHQLGITPMAIGMSTPTNYLNLNSGRIVMTNKEKEKNILLMGIESGDSFASFRNKNGESLVEIGSNNNGHGSINIYDKYGEDFKSYSFK